VAIVAIVLAFCVTASRVVIRLFRRIEGNSCFYIAWTWGEGIIRDFCTFVLILLLPAGQR